MLLFNSLLGKIVVRKGNRCRSKDLRCNCRCRPLLFLIVLLLSLLPKATSYYLYINTTRSAKFDLVDCLLKLSHQRIVCVLNTNLNKGIYSTLPHRNYTAMSKDWHWSVTWQGQRFPAGHIDTDPEEHSLWIPFPLGAAIISFNPTDILQVLAEDSMQQQLWMKYTPMHEPPHLPSDTYIVAATSVSQHFWEYADTRDNRLKNPTVDVFNDASQLQVIDEWVDYHSGIGFDHIFMYIDMINGTETSFLRQLRSLLADRPQVSLIHISRNTHQDFGFQIALGLHSLHLVTGSSVRWLATFDIDEYFEPMRRNVPILHILEANPDYRHASTFQLLSVFWYHAIHDFTSWKANISEIPARSSGYLGEPGYNHPYDDTNVSYIGKSRQKCLFNVTSILYFSVHYPTNPFYLERLDPGREMHVNHFKGYGTYYRRERAPLIDPHGFHPFREQVIARVKENRAQLAQRAR